MSERRSFSDKTPWQIACEWYGENDIARSISEKRWHNEIPRDVNSRAFAAWLTDQYRLAMAKGVQLGRGDTRCIGRPERLALCDEVERLRAELQKAVFLYDTGEKLLDEAREAARWLLPFTINTPHTQVAIERWPWLEE